MVASDTVVGIVGAVVLVAVMAGVFVYEYNNPTNADADGKGDAAHMFAEKYPALNASDDIDQDGIPNLEDDDMDGDGTPNMNDTEVAVMAATPGNRPTLAPGSTDAGTKFAIYVGEGAVHLKGTLTYTTTTPSPAPADKVLSVVVQDASGNTVATGTLTRSTTTATINYEVADIPAGSYTILVRMTQPGQATAFNGSAFVHYPAPAAMDHEHA